MNIVPSQRVDSIGAYAFDVVDKMRDKLKKKGVKVIDFGVGDPVDPTPSVVREACRKAVEERKCSGYPRNFGSSGFLQAVAEWNKKRFGIELDSTKEIATSIGAKEAVFNFPLGFINPGDYVLVPNPGYPPYERGTIFAGGNPYFMNLLEKNSFLPDLEAIPAEIAKKAKIMWINYPNNPTTALATRKFYKEAIDFCHDNNIILASDEAYSEMYYDGKPRSILELEREGVVVINSLSKRSNMTGYRIGWVCGDEKIISVFKKVKANIDSGTPWFIQDAAVAALKDETHVENMRASYRQKLGILGNALNKTGLPDSAPHATFYIWQKVPDNYTSLEFAKKLLDEKIAIVVTPGTFLGNEADGFNPGEGFVRFALVPGKEETEEAAERIKKLEL